MPRYKYKIEITDNETDQILIYLMNDLDTLTGIASVLQKTAMRLIDNVEKTK